MKEKFMKKTMQRVSIQEIAEIQKMDEELKKIQSEFKLIEKNREKDEKNRRE